MLPGFFHDTLGERDRAPAVAQIRDFILRALRRAGRAGRPARGAPAAATRATRRDALAAPLSPLSPRGALLGRDARQPDARRRAVRRHQARPRHRLRLGQHARLRLSQPAARALGRSAASIDSTYLDSIGWRGIRQRKLHVEELLAQRDGAAAPKRHCRCASSTSPPATAATCSTRSTASPVAAGLDPAARLQRPQRRATAAR